MFPGLFFNQSIILTQLGQSLCYSHNPECQGGKPDCALPVLKTLVCHGRGSNPLPPTHEAEAQTTMPPRQLCIIYTQFQIIVT